MYSAFKCRCIKKTSPSSSWMPASIRGNANALPHPDVSIALQRGLQLAPAPFGVIFALPQILLRHEGLGSVAFMAKLIVIVLEAGLRGWAAGGGSCSTHAGICCVISS